LVEAPFAIFPRRPKMCISLRVNVDFHITTGQTLDLACHFSTLKTTMSFQPPPSYRSGAAGMGGMGGGGYGPPAPPFGGAPPAYGGNQGSYNAAAAPFGGGGPRVGPNQSSTDDKLAKVRDPLLQGVKWLKTRSPKEKTALGAVAGVLVRGGRGCRQVCYLPTNPCSFCDEPQSLYACVLPPTRLYSAAI
jgi:hypothetical protein